MKKSVKEKLESGSVSVLKLKKGASFVSMEDIIAAVVENLGRHRREQREPRSRHSGRDRHGRDEDQGEAVIGLGDHVPAFLLRSLSNS